MLPVKAYPDKGWCEQAMQDEHAVLVYASMRADALEGIDVVRAHKRLWQCGILLKSYSIVFCKLQARSRSQFSAAAEHRLLVT